MDEKPAEAVRAKPDSSLVVGVPRRRRGRADAVVSAGNTGAMLAAGLLEIRRAAGRPPAGDRRRDPGALRAVGADRRRGERRLAPRAPRPVRAHGLDLRRGDPRACRTPRCACSRSARSRRRATSSTSRRTRCSRERAQLPGNTEARELLRCAADVVVADGFTGNVALKLLEGTIKELLDALREEIAATTRGKLGGLLIRPAARRAAEPARPGHLRRRLPARAPGLAVIAHGNSSRTAIANAIRLAARGVENGVVGSSVGDRGMRGRFRAPRRPRPNEVRWQRRAKKSSSESRKS